MRINKTDAFLFIFLAGLFVYVLLRTITLDITNDEAYSFYIMKNFWYAEALCTGNTHWLNSLAIKASILLHFESPWQIRWFSTLSTFVFFSLIFVWIRSVGSLEFKFLIFSVLLLNPYILDYLGLARGYAPGLMFEALAVFFFYRALQNNNSKHYFFALLCSGLSALANFSFVYFFAAFSLIYFSRLYFKDKKNAIRSPAFYRDCFYVFIISFLVVKAFIFMTRCSNDVVGAGTSDFSEYPLVFLHGLLYDRATDSMTLKFLSPTIFMGIVLSCLVGLFRKNAAEDKLYFFSSQILLVMLITIGILHAVFGVVFPYYRSAIFLFPTTAICFISMVNKLADTELLKKIILSSLSILLAINFIFSINLKSVFDYYQQANLAESFDYLETIGAKHAGMSPELYGSFRNYYQVITKKKYNFIGDLINSGSHKNESIHYKDLATFDYLLVAAPYDLSYYQGSGIKTEALKWFRESGTLVLKVENGF